MSAAANNPGRTPRTEWNSAILVMRKNLQNNTDSARFGRD
jgi:hypothetical protein